MKNEKLEKQASSEIAQSRERFRKFLVDQQWPFSRQAVIAAMEWAERDTRERIYQLLQSEASLYEINGRECDASGNTIGGFGDVNAAIALKRMAERIRGKE